MLAARHGTSWRSRTRARATERPSAYLFAAHRPTPVRCAQPRRATARGGAGRGDRRGPHDPGASVGPGECRGISRACPVTAALVCRPASGLRDLEPGGAAAVSGLAERPLGADQSNTSVVLGERLLLKAYRWLQPGLNPDLELVAYLTEEAGFTAVPPLAGFAELVSRTSEPATVAHAPGVRRRRRGRVRVARRDADRLAARARAASAWSSRPRSPPTSARSRAGLHAALAVGARRSRASTPRPATRDELRGWHDGCAHAAGRARSTSRRARRARAARPRADGSPRS